MNHQYDTDFPEYPVDASIDASWSRSAPIRRAARYSNKRNFELLQQEIDHMDGYSSDEADAADWNAPQDDDDDGLSQYSVFKTLR